MRRGGAGGLVASTISQLARSLFSSTSFFSSYVRIVLSLRFLIFLVIVLRCLGYGQRETEIPHCNVYVLKHVQQPFLLFFPT